jgi:cell division protein FtsZ
LIQKNFIGYTCKSYFTRSLGLKEEVHVPEVKPDEIQTFAAIKVVGVGGAGGSALNRMKQSGLKGVEFIAINTDAQALHNSLADVKLHIGRDTTRGLGAGADPSVGEQAANESKDEIREILTGADMVFVTFGAGGGTGSGAGPVVAELAREQEVLVVGIATKPFAFEGDKRRRNAELAIQNLAQSVDTLITIPNDRLLQTIDRRTPLMEAFKVADDVLRQGVQGISDLIIEHGLINLDFADVKSVMSHAGSALMGIGHASGENRAVVAAQMAIESPLLEVSIDGARGVLFNVCGGSDMSMHEINEAAEVITSAVAPDANIIFGATIKEDLGDEINITVIATGFDSAYFDRHSVESRVFSDDPDSEPIHSTLSDVDAQDVEKLDMDLPDESSDSGSFQDDTPTPNIWSYDEDEPTETESPAFLRRFKRRKDKSSDEDEKTEES